MKNLREMIAFMKFVILEDLVGNNPENKMTQESSNLPLWYFYL